MHEMEDGRTTRIRDLFSKHKKFGLAFTSEVSKMFGLVERGHSIVRKSKKITLY